MDLGWHLCSSRSTRMFCSIVVQCPAISPFPFAMSKPKRKQSADPLYSDIGQQLQQQSSSSADRVAAIVSPAPKIPSYRQLPAYHDHHSHGHNHRHDSSNDCCCFCPTTRDQLRAMADRVRFLESEVDYHLTRKDQAQHLAHRVRELEGEVGFLRQQQQSKTS